DQDRFDVRRLEAGDVVTVGSVAFEVVDTSGHSPGHRSLYHACSKTMFCGDHVLFSSSPYIPWYPGVPDSFGRYLDSLEHVARWDVAMPLPAHGDVRPRADFAERARWLHEHKSAKVASLLQLIAACPGRTGLELVRALYRIGGAERWEAMSFVSRWCLLANGVSMLDHLVSCGRVEVEVGPDGARRYCAANRGSLQPSGINAAVMPRRR
ncbi:MAG TPA: MBL fold metallo-hydrolase, partial [Candidatus Aveggerthella excrementigallinarum]|nr:MBL fold metallo-hydrolase [Candidatus Aveggerthella excrementigallinarum]